MRQEQKVMQWGTKTLITEFKSIREMVEHNRNSEVNEEAFKYQDSNGKNESFSNTKSYEEAEDLLLNGWTSGAENLNKELKIANKNVKHQRKQKTIYDVVGFQPCVPRYLQGLPTDMINKKTTTRRQKSVTLNKSVCYTGAIKPDDILKDSVKFLQIVQAIEKQGTRVNVNAVFHSVNGNESMFMKVKIKSANERLNISKMSFPLTHPSFLRRIIFRTMEVEHRAKGKWTPGYGRPGNTEDTKKLLNKDEIFIPVLITKNEAEDIINQAK